MYRAINDKVVVKALTASDSIQTIPLEVIATTELTEDLQGKTIFVSRHKIMQFDSEDEDTETKSGIILAKGMKYGVVRLDDILAIKE